MRRLYAYVANECALIPQSKKNDSMNTVYWAKQKKKLTLQLKIKRSVSAKAFYFATFILSRKRISRKMEWNSANEIAQG